MGLRRHAPWRRFAAAVVVSWLAGCTPGSSCPDGEVCVDGGPAVDTDSAVSGDSAVDAQDSAIASDDGVSIPDGGADLDGAPDPDDGVPVPDAGLVSDAEIAPPDGPAVDPCAAGACTLSIDWPGTDILVVNQTIPISASWVTADGDRIAAEGVEWSASACARRTGCLEFVGDAMRGLSYGGGDQNAVDGTVWIKASLDGMVTEEYPIQIVELREGVGIYPLGAQLGSAAPEPGAPPPQGASRYDGLHLLDVDEQSWYCTQDADCPDGGICDAEHFACVDDQGTLQPILRNCDWNNEPCSVHRADVRMFIGSQLQLGMRALATYAEFRFGELLEAQPDDYEGLPVARRLRLEWSIVPGMPNDIVEVNPDSGLLTAVGVGRTAVRAMLGPQGIDFEVVVYNKFGYHPTANYTQGIQPEDGHLVMFSSSHGPARFGTHDTIRVMDLQSYTEQDFRPSKFGPQGRRLIENENELFGGGGCGLVEGSDGEIFLLNGRFAIAFDTTTSTQSRARKQVFFQPPNSEEPIAVRVCHGTYWKDPQTQREFLFGFEQTTSPSTRMWVAEVTNLEDGSVLAQPVRNPALPADSRRIGYNPKVWTDAAGAAWLLFVEQGIPDVLAENLLHFSRLQIRGDALAVSFDEDSTIHGEITLQVNGTREAPGLFLAPVGPAQTPTAFIGNEWSISVVDLASRSIVKRMETRWYGFAINNFALSPDGEKLFALPLNSNPQNLLLCDSVDDCPEGDAWACEDGACTFDGDPIRPGRVMMDHALGRRDAFSNHRAAIINLTGDEPEFDETLWDCFVDDEALCQALPFRRLGVDLRYTALKKFMIDQRQTASTGALPAIVGLNVRQMVVTENALVLIGADANDGMGSSLANLSDLAIYNINPEDGEHAHGVVFRGWRGSPRSLQGLSDPFGFRLGDRDQELGKSRVKNAGLMYIPGRPPADNPGDGPERRPDAPVEPSGLYAGAPDVPEDDQGQVILLSSSHAAAMDGTMDVIRRIDVENFLEVDYDPAVDGAQGLRLDEGDVEGGFAGGCGMIAGPDGEIWVFSGRTAVAYDPGADVQLYGGNVIQFPGAIDMRVCTGTIHIDGDTKLLYAFDSFVRGPQSPIFVVDLNALVDGSVEATALEDPYLEPYMIGVDRYVPRYVQGAVHDGSLYFLEKNEGRSKLRNIVHRAEIQPDGTLVFDPSRDLEGGFTDTNILAAGDPGMSIAPFMGVPHLFIGNQSSLTIYDLSNDLRLDYNADGDGIHDDLDTFNFGRSLTAFTINRDGTKLYALPKAKSERQPVDTIAVPMVGGGTRLQGVDRFRVVVLDLTRAVDGKPGFDMETNNGNGIDLIYTYLKQHLVDGGVSPGGLPPIFLNVRSQIAVSLSSLFIVGNDHPDGIGTALANARDVGTYSLKIGRGYIWRDWVYEGLQNASSSFGFRLGVLDGVEDANIGGRSVKSAGVLWVP